MPSLKCGSCGNIIPLPKCIKHEKEVIVAELNGQPSIICAVEGEKCASQPLPKCCVNPAYSRWL